MELYSGYINKLIEELAALPELKRRAAEEIYGYFRKKEERET